MIEIMFSRANEVVVVRITGHKVEFGNTTFGAKLGTIEGLKLDYTGTVREFPDLMDDLDWRVKAIERFKAHIKKLDNENNIMKYIIDELGKHGYKAHYYQKAGGRPVKLACHG